MQTDTGEHSLTVLSYNIHKGFSAGNRRFVLGGIRDAIRRVNANIVFLQEVVGEHERHLAKVEEWPTVSQFEYLADQVWTDHAYGRNAVYDEGHHGNAILSNHPIIAQDNYSLAKSRFEARGMLLASVQLPDGRVIHCVCTHLGLTRRNQLKQLDKLCRYVNEHVPPDEPLILAGDFNDWSGVASRILERELNVFEHHRRTAGKYAKTFPSRLCLLPLDRIYCRGFKVSHYEVLRSAPWNKLSDHAAITADLEIPLPVQDRDSAPRRVETGDSLSPAATGDRN